LQLDGSEPNTPEEVVTGKPPPRRIGEIGPGRPELGRQSAELLDSRRQLSPKISARGQAPGPESEVLACLSFSHANQCIIIKFTHGLMLLDAAAGPHEVVLVLHLSVITKIAHR